MKKEIRVLGLIALVFIRLAVRSSIKVLKIVFPVLISWKVIVLLLGLITSMGWEGTGTMATMTFSLEKAARFIEVLNYFSSHLGGVNNLIIYFIIYQMIVDFLNGEHRLNYKIDKKYREYF